MVNADELRARVATMSAIADPAQLARAVGASIGQPPLAGDDQTLIELGVGIARAGQRGFDRTLLALTADPTLRAAALLVLAGYWRGAERVEPAVYRAVVDDVALDPAAWDGDQADGLAALAAIAALTVHAERGVDPADANAARLAVVERFAHTSPYLTGLAERLRAARG